MKKRRKQLGSGNFRRRLMIELQRSMNCEPRELWRRLKELLERRKERKQSFRSSGIFW